MEPRRELRRLAAVLIAVTALSAVGASPAAASFPGSNGKLLYSANDEAGNYWIAVSPPPYTISTTIASAGTLGDFLEPDGAIWSANGQTIAFDTNDGAIWMMNANGGNQRQVIPPPQNGFLEVTGFSPNDSLILYTKESSSGNSISIWEANSNGTGRHRLETPPPGAIDRDATFSPNGHLIAFDRTTCGATTCRAQIWRMNALGGQQVNLSSNSRDDFGPDWSPNGQNIVFDRSFDVRPFHQVFTMTSSGANQTNITQDNANDGSATWSPNGNWIVYNRFTSIYRIHPNGTSKTELVAGGPGFEADGPSIRPLP